MGDEYGGRVPHSFNGFMSKTCVAKLENTECKKSKCGSKDVKINLTVWIIHI